MENHVAVVTGAGRGIGQGIASQLAKAGWQIVINDVSPVEKQADTLELVQQAGSEGITVQGDITKAADRERIIHQALNTLWENRHVGQ